MPVFSRSIWIRAPIALVYDFHLNTHNIELITPSWQKIESLKLPDRIETGAHMQLVVRVLGLRQDWEIEWETLQPPDGEPAKALLADRALRSPFRKWRHEHEIIEQEGGVMLTDRVDFEPSTNMPFAQPFYLWMMEQMFRFRQRRTRAILQEMTNPTLPRVVPDPRYWK